MLSEAELKEGTDFALKVAPEAESSGLKLLNRIDGVPTPKYAEAVAIRGRNIPIRDELLRRGEWPGSWGLYIMFVTEPKDTNEFLAKVLHEMGHGLPAREPLIDDGSEPTIEQRTYQSVQLAAWCETYRQDGEPWGGHDLTWIRRVLHLYYRAERAGFRIPLDSINVAGPTYGLSMPINYEVALATEPQRFAKRTFAEIEAEPMPPRFVKLFAQDAAEFYFNDTIERYTRR